MDNKNNEYENARNDLFKQYHAFEKHLNGLLEDKESTASINASSLRFRHCDPYEELKYLRECFEDYLSAFNSHVSMYELECTVRNIGAMEDFFASLTGEYYIFELPDLPTHVYARGNYDYRYY